MTLAATANDGGASVAYGPAGDADTALADHQVAVPDEAEATVQDRVVPALASASVNGTILTLTYNEALDAASKPAAEAFAVTVAGDARTVDAVALSESAVALTLASAVAAGETVTVGYTVPTGTDAAPLQDAAGNDAASFTERVREQ